LSTTSFSEFFSISSEAYPSFHITHLTLAYNIAQLQHVYKRRLVIKSSALWLTHLPSSELNLRIWQQSKKMFEQSGLRPVVYNNKCGQLCGVRERHDIPSRGETSFLCFLVLCERGSSFGRLSHPLELSLPCISRTVRLMLLNTTRNCTIPTSKVWSMNMNT
jgi:hypothetical protein